MLTAHFDARAFAEALDGVRAQRRYKWYEVFRQTGISYDTMRNMRTRGSRPNADTLAALCAWSGLTFMDYVVTTWNGVPLTTDERVS